ncbi:MAG: hypothetical protein R3B84_24045 [Zavarzinella sp.]
MEKAQNDQRTFPTPHVVRGVLFFLLIFWQGGFMFYGLIVVPIGAEITGSDFQQGLITQQVTHYLNLSGGMTLLVALLYLAVLPISRRKKAWATAIWAILLATLIAQVMVHIKMDLFIDLENQKMISRKQFRPWHAGYLCVSTAQWAIALLFGGWLLYRPPTR